MAVIVKKCNGIEKILDIQTHDHLDLSASSLASGDGKNLQLGGHDVSKGTLYRHHLVPDC